MKTNWKHSFYNSRCKQRWKCTMRAVTLTLNRSAREMKWFSQETYVAKNKWKKVNFGQIKLWMNFSEGNNPATKDQCQRRNECWLKKRKRIIMKQYTSKYTSKRKKIGQLLTSLFSWFLDVRSRVAMDHSNGSYFLIVVVNINNNLSSESTL